MFTSGSFLQETEIASAVSIVALRISARDMFLQASSRILMNHAFSVIRAASRKNGMPCFFATADAARRFARLTGCPPPELFVTVTMMSGMFSAPYVAMADSSLAISTFPLNGASSAGSNASSTTQSTGIAPFAKTCALVVSNGMLKRMYCPFFTSVPKTMFSAARPWWVGMT